jgi:hypothetical protein
MLWTYFNNLEKHACRDPGMALLISPFWPIGPPGDVQCFGAPLLSTMQSFLEDIHRHHHCR